MKILTVDIETRPNLVWTWGLWNQNISIGQIEKPGEVICFAAKWHGKREIIFSRDIQDAWALLDEADAVVGWNSERFDMTHLNREFILAGLGIPSPYVNIDLLKTVRKRFKFLSNKLDYVAGQLLGEQKTAHTGFKLWLDCMNEDPKAWKLMEKYNRQDVALTEKLYDKLLPWIQSHPSVPLLDGSSTGCPACGSMKMEKRGLAHTAVSTFQQYHCMNPKCGRWFRGTKRIQGSEYR